ncbi:MAG TPA: ABC transporter substrate-binding protein [Candidatus Sulfotelmatobacter sp.]|nr:ABC transporter substrate-binding protein [Candidatus Sulfotelmatobacter sp.]
MPVTRRVFVQGALAGAGVLAGLVGRAPAAAPAPKRGGVWRIAGWMTPPTLDVHRISQYWACLGGMYDCLLSTRVNSKTLAVELLPGLATDWQVEKDGKRILFTLRKSVQFHDGSKFDASVAKWNLDRLRSHPKSLLKADLTEIESVQALSGSTLAVNLHYPSASLLYNLSAGRLWAGMVSQSFQEKRGDDELARKGCGTGAFRCKEWIVDQKVVLERFPDYWRTGEDGKPLPYLDGMEEHYRPQIDKAVVDLRAGDLDSVIDPAERDAPTVMKDPNLAYVELPPFEYQKICIGFNARQGPFASHALRQAACYAIDRERIAKMLGYGVGRVHQYPYIAKGQPGWAPEQWTDYSFNLKKAAELARVDYPRGVTVELFSISREPDNTYAQLIKAMWEAAGIKTELKSLERLGWIEAMNKDRFQAGFWSSASYIEVFVRPKFSSGSMENWSNFRHPEVDRLLEEHVKTLDQKKRAAIMAQVFKIISASAETTCAFATTHAVATHKRVKGLRTHWRYEVASEVWLDA